jgi:hypothetical protein
MFDPISISESNLNYQPTLASLSALNHSLREQVVNLLLSIAVLKETQGAGANSQPMYRVNIGREDPRATFSSPQSAGVPKKRARGQQSIKRSDRQL